MHKLHTAAILLAIGLAPVAPANAAACTQTVNPGTNIAPVVSSAAAGSTICLNSGSYGQQSLDNISKSGEVTIRSASGQDAIIDINIGGSTGRLIFESLTVTGSYVQGTPKNLTFRGNKFTGQIVLRMDGNSNANILLDGNTFNGINACANCYEGRVQVQGGAYPVGVTITNNLFGGAGESDGIQIGAPGVVVGPGNVFDGIVQGNYGRHVDAIQGYGQSRTTITGNYFKNGDTYLMFPDGGTAEQITNNVFDGGSRGNNGIQLGSHNGDSFHHNTVRNVVVNMDKKVENPTPSQNAVASNNILIGTTFKTVDSNGTAACSNCTFSFNLFVGGGNAKGSNALVGTPAFVGGSAPTTWAGWQLTSGSIGYGAGSDGTDMGATYFGGPKAGPAVPPTPPAPLSPPANLIVK
jgi:hypothetical protein